MPKSKENNGSSNINKSIKQWGKTVKALEKDIKKFSKTYAKEDEAGQAELASQIDAFKAELEALYAEVCSVPGVQSE